MDKNEQPLILVFYMYHETLVQGDMMKVISEAVEESLKKKGVNAVCFYVPTKDNERVECINPVLATEEQIEQINKLIEDIEKNFDIGQVDAEKLDEEDYEGSAVKPFKTDES